MYQLEIGILASEIGIPKVEMDIFSNTRGEGKLKAKERKACLHMFLRILLKK